MAAEYDADADLLTLVVRNTSAGSGDVDTGWILTGIGFDLPADVDVDGDDAATRPNVALTAGSSLIGEEPFDDLDDSRWGFTNLVDGGHFLDPSRLDPNTVISTYYSDDAAHSDTDFTFENTVANNDNIATFNFGLQSANANPGGPPGRPPYVQDSLTFTIQLTANSYSPDQILTALDRRLVVAFGDPNSAQLVPEPSSLLLGCIGLGAIGLLARRRSRRATA